MQTDELSEFGNILLFIIGAILFFVVIMTLARLLRPHRPNAEKLTTYECGEETVGNAWGQFNIRFYIVALIFILFDVELVFLFPWAVVFGDRNLNAATDGLWGWFALTEMFIFVAVLALGLAYAWVKGHLDWVKPALPTPSVKSVIPTHLYDQVNRNYAGKTANRPKTSGTIQEEQSVVP
jgi:NADH-quinone oxidoreductase subunit A